MCHHNLQHIVKKAKKLAKYRDIQEQLGNELPINVVRLKSRWPLGRSFA